SEEAKRLPLSSDFYHDNYSRNQRATAIGATACTERRQQQSKPQHVRSADNSNRSHSMYIAKTTAIRTTACTERRQQQSEPQHVRSADNSNQSHSMHAAQ